jgi:hypothetical protein
VTDKTQDAEPVDDLAATIFRARTVANECLSAEALQPDTRDFMRDVIAVCDLATELQRKSDNLDINILKPCWN